MISFTLSACSFVERQLTAACDLVWDCTESGNENGNDSGDQVATARPARFTPPDIHSDRLFYRAPEDDPEVRLHARIIVPDRPLQCVPYARKVSRIQIRGDARTWWRQAEGLYARSGRPMVGAVLALRPRGASRGHVAVVTHILNEREIVVEHSNWLNQGRIHKDTPVRDVSKAGDWSRVNVWYTPGRRYGASSYRTFGFILPTLEVAEN